MVTFTNSSEVSCVNKEDGGGHNEEQEESTEEYDSSSSSEEEENGAMVSIDDVAKSKPSFGSITVAHSSDVHFGNKTFYQGPVTIKQIVYAKNGQSDVLNGDDGSVLRDDRLILDCAQIGGEKLNGGFVNDEQAKGECRAQNGRVVGDVYQPKRFAMKKFNNINGCNVYFTDMEGIILDEDFLLDYILQNENPLIVIKSRNVFYEYCHKWMGGLSRQQTLLVGILGISFLISMVILIVILTVIHFEAFENNNNQNDSSVGHKWIGGLSRQQSLLIGILGILFVLSLVILIVVLTVKKIETSKGNKNQNNEDYIGTPIESPVDSDAFNATLPNNVRIVSRVEWVAQPPVEPSNDLNVPVPYVIIWHTATENCSDIATCVFHVRTIQTFHIDSRHWGDIAYNFLVGGDGNAYEGRGWKKEGTHTVDYNNRSIGIAFIGTFISIKPPEWQINACKVLINMGVKQGYIAKDYKILAAKQLTGTQAPGAVLYEEIKTWPHWSALP